MVLWSNGLGRFASNEVDLGSSPGRTSKFMLTCGPMVGRRSVKAKGEGSSPSGSAILLQVPLELGYFYDKETSERTSPNSLVALH